PAASLGVVVEADGPLAVAVDGRPWARYAGRVEVAASGGRLLVVNALPLERYLVGVVGLEMDPAWPLEALKAQAVASRTYALHQRRARRAGGQQARPAWPYDLEAGILDQAYSGLAGEDARAAAAVLATREEWLADAGGEPILALFHSTAGGRTEAAAEVFRRPLPYLVSLLCPFDRASPVFAWRWTVAVEEVEARLLEAGYPAAGLEALGIGERTASGRVRTVLVETRAGRFALPATELRRLLGYGRLRSTRFAVEREGAWFRFDGQGAGHGVGLCQWGARGMALAGHGYLAILSFYYPGTRWVRGTGGA
ncbi:MAG TPA: SpoIID/LytB domain-containing protein, partial [Thermodesulfobacteriota bacterium]|nr:SpoIID/LytB domain-containing protein [Thermodesulfobacteriota bacterium]